MSRLLKGTGSPGSRFMGWGAIVALITASLIFGACGKKDSDGNNKKKPPPPTAPQITSVLPNDGDIVGGLQVTILTTTTLTSKVHR